MGFREPDGRAEVVDVRVGQQDRTQVVDAEPQLPQRIEDVLAVARETSVDQHDAVVVGDQRPIDQVGLGEMHVVGDGRQDCCHAASLGNRVEK